jgi:aerobic-type carbon monoxide dehydrogenase small subunit (CoxS/CutS family)
MNPQRVLKLTINGQPRDVLAEPNAILLDVLREQLHLTGSKRGCDMGTCGCCTVLIDGQNRLSCLTLAAQADGKAITTIEGLGTGEALHPIQAAFSDVGGSQCGFCTPGFIMTTKALLDKNPKPNEAQIREAISGNLCRCTGYIKIIEAVQTAARDLEPATKQATPALVSARRPSA